MITVFTFRDWVLIGIVGLSLLFMVYGVAVFYFKKLGGKDE